MIMTLEYASLDDAFGAVVSNDAPEPEPTTSSASEGAEEGASDDGATPAPSDDVEASSAPPEGEEGASEETEEPADPEADTDPAPPQNERLGRIAKRLRDERRTLARELGEVRQLKTELEQMRSSANPWAEVADLARKNPSEALERFAEMSGTTTASILEKYARKAIGKPSEPSDEIASLREELNQFKTAQLEREKQETQRQQQMQVQASINAGVEELMNIQKPEFAAQYPYASALDPADLRAECKAAIQFLVDNNMSLPADELAEVIDKKIERLVRPVINRSKSTLKQPISPVSAPVSKPKTTALTNADAASVPAPKPMTEEERIRAAADAIGKGITY